MTAKCPRCFVWLSPDIYTYECTGQCPYVDDPAASDYAGGTVRIRRHHSVRRPPNVRTWVPPSQVSCDICHQASREICPICHVALIPYWRTARTTCIALAGARATGKSIYLGILVKQLEQSMTRLHMPISFGDEQSRRLYEDNYQRPLYEAMGIMVSTPTASVNEYSRLPMILDLGLRSGQRNYLVFRDVAGEDLESPAHDQTYLSYFQRADAVMFLFDPSAVADVRELLRDFLPAQVNEVGNPERVLENVLRLMGTAPAPIAMVLSKFDTIQALRAVKDDLWRKIMSNPGAAFCRDPGIYQTTYDRADGALLHLEVRSLLSVLHAQRFVNALGWNAQGTPYRHQFFTVSALGEAARGAKLHPHGIAPFRCLDPLRWVLDDQVVPWSREPEVSR